MLEKTYQPREIEQDVARLWEERGAFRAGLRPDAKPFSIVIPPPNVTGSLHMGHALNNTLQDVLARFERMRGRDVLWQPGMDHAGIATQMVVERQLMERQEPDRRTMGREAFLARVWAWKAESGGKIIEQLKRLGASCDWSRERFTMDEGLSRAVTKVFVDLYRQGLIYKDKRLVNWDPKLLTAISDLEVQQVETKGNLWHFRYPIAGEGGRYIVVATTRPETMLGDTAVAVHPEDDRYQKLIGKTVILPLVGREIPIIADDYADPEQGSGAVKITPAHDFNDFEVGKRHDLPMINILNADGSLNDQVPEPYRNLDRFEARKSVVSDLDILGLLEKIDPHMHAVPHGDRSGAPIEPYLTDQWYVDAKTLAAPAIDAIEQGRTTFVPTNWEKTYFEWMRNIQPWCISRQLWWGHQIPAWYGPSLDNLGRETGGPYKVFVAETKEEALAAAQDFYGDDIEVSIDRSAEELALAPNLLTTAGSPTVGSESRVTREITLQRDPDVLDTWFSSALWPFSTMGWPDETAELERYYPTSVLVTGFDIIFFWVARMMMMGMHLMQEAPFHDVYIHALVRDEKGQKMSKSKGNVIDPLDLIDEYGADALRFTLTAMAAQGRDIKLATARVEGYRNFGTKLWNAARFAEMNGCRLDPDFDPAAVKQTVNRWIVGESNRALAAITDAIEGYRFNDAASAIYEFVWRVFCDWYVELVKPVLTGTDAEAVVETRACAAWVLDRIVRVLHPVMPFVTEKLWAEMQLKGAASPPVLALAAWPSAVAIDDASARAEMEWVIRLVSDVRSVRAEMGVPAGARLPLVISGAGEATQARVNAHAETIARLARLSDIELGAISSGAVQVVLDEATLALPLGEVVDLRAESDRLKREIAKVGSEIKQLDGKLANRQFVDKAPEHVVEESRTRKADAEATAAKLKQALSRLEAAL